MRALHTRIRHLVAARAGAAVAVCGLVGGACLADSPAAASVDPTSVDRTPARLTEIVAPARLPSMGAAKWAAPTLAATSAGASELPLAGVAAEAGSHRAPDHAGFYAVHLLPRLERRFADLGMRDPRAVLALHGPSVSNAYEDFTREAERRAERATQRALQDYILETSGLETRAELWFDRRGRKSAAGVESGADADGRRLGIRVGVSHLLPKVDLDYPVGQASTVRLQVRLHGELGVEYETGRRLRSRVYAGYREDHDGRYDLEWRLRF